MKLRAIFCLLFVTFLHANTDFLSLEEYQQNLYLNPRGIGCDKCHGDDGSEQIFATYYENGVKKFVKIPAINNLDFYRFKSTLKSKTSKKNMMPNYFLTDNEIKNLYLYLKKRSKNDK